MPQDALLVIGERHHVIECKFISKSSTRDLLGKKQTTVGYYSSSSSSVFIPLKEYDTRMLKGSPENPMPCSSSSPCPSQNQQAHRQLQHFASNNFKRALRGAGCRHRTLRVVVRSSSLMPCSFMESRYRLTLTHAASRKAATDYDPRRRGEDWFRPILCFGCEVARTFISLWSSPKRS